MDLGVRMSNILNEIVASKHREIEEARRRMPEAALSVFAWWAACPKDSHEFSGARVTTGLCPRRGAGGQGTLLDLTVMPDTLKRTLPDR